uniref:Uncharacterized protein n=1 Tax=Glossina austeni TaxID=7395 RepID=A0A1A9VKK9_GLOAU
MSSSSSNFNFTFENFTGEGDVSSSMVAILGTLKGVLFPHVEDELTRILHQYTAKSLVINLASTKDDCCSKGNCCISSFSKIEKRDTIVAAVAVLSTGDLINISETNVMSTGGAISRLTPVTPVNSRNF